MKPEELKIIAEGMGYEVISYNTLLRVIKHGKSTIPFEYRPDTTNDTQCMEIIEKLEMNLSFIDSDLWQALAGIDFGMTGGIEGRGKTINEAVCKAALEYFNKL